MKAIASWIGALALVAGIIAASLNPAATSPVPQPVPLNDAVFDLHALGPGVYAAVVVANPPAYAFANSLVVIGRDGVLVVDTQQSLTAARSLIGEIARLTPKPVRWVVNTHWHADHVNGNQAYAQAFPGVEFIAHATLAEDLRVRGAAWRTEELARLPDTIAARRGWLEAGAGPDGAPLTDVTRAAVSRSLALREAYLDELRRIDPTPPTRTFDDRLEFSVGEHRVLLLHAGPAHTRGDILVALPELRLVAVGDLLEAAMPYFGDATISGWRRALERIAELQPAVTLPSHGPVQRNGELLADSRDLLEAIRAATASGVEVPASGAEALDPALAKVERRWADRYGVTPEQFRDGLRTAIRRAGGDPTAGLPGR